MNVTIVDRYTWGALGVVGAVNLLWFAVSRVELVWSALTPSIITLAGLIVLHRVARRPLSGQAEVSRRRVLEPLLHGMIFLNVAWINLRVFNHLTMTTALPYTDDMLVRWDVAFGFDWLAYFEFVHGHPFLISLLDLAYSSLTPLSVAALVGLLLSGQVERGRYFIEAFSVTAIIATTIGLFFPAEAAVAFLLDDMSRYPNFSATPGVYHLALLEALRMPEGPILLHPQSLPGLVTFPSFHTGAGIVLCGAFWRSRAFPLVAVYAAVMIASTPIFGGHYIVDLVFGALLALAVLVVLARREAHRGLFSPDASTSTRHPRGAAHPLR